MAVSHHHGVLWQICVLLLITLPRAHVISGSSIDTTLSRGLRHCRTIIELSGSAIVALMYEVKVSIAQHL
jgi:hypothetical protein